MNPESMSKDLRNSDLYREAEALHTALRQPGTGQISDAAEVHVTADGAMAVFTGALVDTLHGSPASRICLTDLSTGDTRVVTFGPHTDRSPRFSPDGRHIAFLSDRHRAGDFQLHLLDPESGAARATPRVAGWVEYLQWSPDGTRILLGVAGHGADVSGGQGAVTSKQAAQELPSWMPSVETGDESYRWRSAWVYDLTSDRVRRVSAADSNVWESAWCGNEALAAVTSPGPSEGLWYSARLALVELSSGNSREVYTPKDQLGWPAASPSGRHLAVVESLCSDRWLVAGDLRLLDTTTGDVRRVDTRGVDIAYTEWRSDTHLLLGGHRGFETVIGVYDTRSGTFTETWRSEEVTTGGRYITAAGFN